MAPKIFLGIENKIDLIEKLPVIQLMDSLSLGPVLEKDKAAYFQMAVDEELNRYWGYDYKEDFPEKEPDEDDIFLSFQKDFESKNEVSFGLHFKDRLIGEVVFNKIKMNNTSEIGIRIIKAYQGLGYAKKALSAACQYAFEELDYPYISACCFKENIPSQKSLISSGFIKAGEDEKMLRFVKIRK
jgi:RimJ/RimL family protein N-acetyltransferase